MPVLPGGQFLRIPVLDRSKEDWKTWFTNVLESPKSQRKIVLIIVCIALLLDNMLYMVIVPIIPKYIKELGEFRHTENISVACLDTTIKGCTNFTEVESKEGEQTAVGWLFASKAMVQIFIGPIVGTIIDHVGYDKPMASGLAILFVSTTIFAYGTSYWMLLFARGLQGVGSAFADTSGLAMIADRYKEEGERTKALGIALAFISFGSLVAPPYGGFLASAFNKTVPFMLLSLVALLDGLMLLLVMAPIRRERQNRQQSGEPMPKGTPIYKLMSDPYIFCVAGALAMSNVCLAFIEPTMSTWMDDTMEADEWETGVVWLPGFFPHVTGVFLTVYLAKKYFRQQWLIAAIGLFIEGFSSLLLPYCTNYFILILPICGICFGIALVDTAMLPTLGHLVDTRHTSVYGSVYAIADISYALAYSVGPVVAGNLVEYVGFTKMNIITFLVTIAYCPFLLCLRNVYEVPNPHSRPAGEEDTTAMGEYDPIKQKQPHGDFGATDNADYVQNDANYQTGGGYEQPDGYQAPATGQTADFNQTEGYQQSYGYQ